MADTKAAAAEDPCAELIGKALLVIPEGLLCLLAEMSREVMCKQPSNIPQFLVEFFEEKLRQSGRDPRRIEDNSTRNPMDKPGGDPVNAEIIKIQDCKDEGKRTNIGGPSGEFAPPDSTNTGTTPGVQPTTNVTSGGFKDSDGQSVAQTSNPQAPFGYGPDGKTSCVPYGRGKNGLPLTEPDPLAPFGYHPSDGLPLATNDPTAPFGFSLSGNALASRDPNAPLGYDIHGRPNSTPETIAFCGDSVQDLGTAAAAEDLETTGQLELRPPKSSGQNVEAAATGSKTAGPLQFQPPESLRQGNDGAPPSRKEQGNGVQLVDLVGLGQQQETQTSRPLVTTSTTPQPGPGVQNKDTQESLTPMTTTTNSQNSIALTSGALTRQSAGGGGVMYIGGPAGSMILNYDPSRVNPVQPPINHMANACACSTEGLQGASQVGVVDCAEVIRQAVEGMLMRVMSMMTGIMSQNQQQCAPLIQNASGIIPLSQPQPESGNSQPLKQQPQKQEQIPLEPTITIQPVSSGKVLTNLDGNQLDSSDSGNVDDGGSSNDGPSEPMVGTQQEGQPETGSTRPLDPVPAETGCQSIETSTMGQLECCVPVCCCLSLSQAGMDQLTNIAEQPSKNSEQSTSDAVQPSKNSEASTSNALQPAKYSEQSTSIAVQPSNNVDQPSDKVDQPSDKVDQSSNNGAQSTNKVDVTKPPSTTTPPLPSSRIQTDENGRRRRCIPPELRPYVPGETCGAMTKRTPPPIPPRLKDTPSALNDYIGGIVVRAADIMKTACGTGSGLAIVSGGGSRSTIGNIQPSSGTSTGAGSSKVNGVTNNAGAADGTKFSELEGLCNGAGLEAFKDVGKQLQQLAPQFEEQFSGPMGSNAETTLNLLTTVGVLLDTIEDTGLTQMDPVLMCSDETLKHLTDVSEKVLFALKEHLEKLAVESPPPSTSSSVEENGMAQITRGAHEALCLAAESLEVAVGILRDTMRLCEEMKEHPELVQKCATDFAATKKIYEEGSAKSRIEEGSTKSSVDDGTSPDVVANGHAATQASQGLGTSSENISVTTGNGGIDNPNKFKIENDSGQSSASGLFGVESGPTAPAKKYGSTASNNSNSGIITRQLSKTIMAGDDEDGDNAHGEDHNRALYNTNGDKVASSDLALKRPNADAGRPRTSLGDLTIAAGRGGAENPLRDNWSGNVGRFMTHQMTSVQNLLSGQTPLSEARGQLVFLTVSFVIGVIVGYAVSRSVGFFGLGCSCSGGSSGGNGGSLVSARAIEAVATTISTSSRVAAAAAASPSPIVAVHGVKCSVLKGAGCTCTRQ